MLFVTNRMAIWSTEMSCQWRDTKDQLMEELIKCKFAQNADLAEKLCNTGTLVLGEANSYDRYWETGISIVSRNTMTQNQ